ncbi:xanthine dehydrogenase family protein subunit M [Stappia sp. ES.058]|uniref:FAD binding domain-containing protein n=1 Tax=Stappia sp. ES.058 TaxID=1881061 RepID=UPI00087ADBB9|nr:xanthine dehydrogenase family protein subunit M [Stappia sp. ES.058]SDU18320.1 carbon-monoxide dehydrogenase medium subunit [Stappia sp. ES.058]
MKSPAFDYIRVNSVADALEAYRSLEGEGVYLAGGHSVVPSLTLRLQAPAALIDLSGIDALSGISLQGGWLRIGAMTRHAEIASDPLIREHARLFHLAAPHVAHPAIRNRGTLGGSLSLADPASEFPAVALALRAEMEIAGADGIRRVKADDFFLDIYETAMEPGEILQAILVPPVRAGQVAVFDELARRRGDYAMVGAAVQAEFDGPGLTDISIAFFSVGNKPTRAGSAEAALREKALDDTTIAAAQAALDGDLEPSDEPQMPASVRRHLARVLLGRLLGHLGTTE